MRITLVHNPNAGYGKHPREELLEMLSLQGFETTYQSTHDDDWIDALDDPGEMVIVAGGDGTVDKVASQFAGRKIPLGILPLGTANNIARGFGINIPIAEIIGGLKTAERRGFDLGVAKGPWGKMNFIEAVGVGAFAQMMPILNSLGKQQSHETREDHLHHELTTLLALVDACRAWSWKIELDGKRISGDYLMVQIMNVSAVGPGLLLAPDADPGDGLLDVVLIEKDDRAALEHYLAKCIKSDRPAAKFPTRQAKNVRLRWKGSMVHVDSTLWSAADERPRNVKKPDNDPPFTIELEVKPQMLEILVPKVKEIKEKGKT